MDLASQLGAPTVARHAHWGSRGRRKPLIVRRPSPAVASISWLASPWWFRGVEEESGREPATRYATPRTSVPKKLFGILP